MAQFWNMYSVDLKKPTGPQPLRQMVCAGDNAANRIGAIVTSDGGTVSLGGSCVGKIVRADGTTVQLSGTISGNQAYVVLDQASCAIVGQIQVAVCWVSGANVTTLVIAYGSVVSTQTGSPVQPSTPIPDLTQLLAEVENMRTATAAANAAATGALTNFAGAFNETAFYTAGQYVTYTDGKFYRLTADHAANVTWANTSKVAVTTGAELINLKQAIATENANIMANFAGAFVQTTAYPAGTYVTYTDGNLYILPNGHEANATWANTTKTQVSVGGELSGLKSALDVIEKQENTCPNFSNFTSGASLEYGVFRCGGTKTTQVGYIKEIQIKTTNAATAKIGVFCLNDDGSATCLLLFSASTGANTVNIYKNGVDFTLENPIPKNAFVGISLPSVGATSASVKYYNDGTPSIWVNGFTGSVGDVISSDKILTYSGYNHAAGMVVYYTDFAYNEQIEKIEDEISDLETEDNKITGLMEYKATKNILDPSLTYSSGYINKSGATGTNTDYVYFTIPASQNDVIRCYARGNKKTKIISSFSGLRFVCEQKSDMVAESSYGSNSAIQDYTVQSANAAYLTITIPKEQHDGDLLMITKNVVPTEYEPYLNAYVAKDDFLWFIEKDDDSEEALSKGFKKTNGNIADGESLTLPKTNVKKNNVYTFFGEITSFTKLIIGHGKGVYNSSYITIDGTNIKMTNFDTNAHTETSPNHNLTFSDFISIQLSVSNEFVAKITIQTGSGTFEHTFEQTWWGDGDSDYYVESVGSVLTDCEFEWGSGDFRKTLWFFGDSYISYANIRWPYYLGQNGWYSNLLFNGYPGETHVTAYASFQNMINNYGKPKFAVWAMGMNGTADTNTHEDYHDDINSSWLMYLNYFLGLCQANDIEPILATIPTVPSRYHEPRNAYVRSLDYRYIDFAKAVGADADGHWYGYGTDHDMLSSDGVHPSVEGAKALFMRAIMDCPEMTFENP